METANNNVALNKDLDGLEKIAHESKKRNKISKRLLEAEE